MAREHRNKSTHAEEILWNYLKKNDLELNQKTHPLLYIFGFLLPFSKMVIEVDGSIHNLDRSKKE